MTLVPIKTTDGTYGLWNLDAGRWYPRKKRGIATKRDAQTKITELTGANK
jgi:hypothetical protein